MLGGKGKPRLDTPEDSILRGFLSLGGGVLAARLVAFVGTAYLARTLGSYGFGIVGLASALTSFAAIGLRHGFEPVGAREVARDPEGAASLAAGVGLLRLAFATLAIGILGIIAINLAKPFEVKLVVVLWGLILIPSAIDPRWTYRGLGRNRWVGISMVLAQAVYVACLFLVVKSPGDVAWVPLSMLAGELTAAGYLALPLLRGQTWRPDLSRAWAVLKSSGFLLASGLLDAVIRVTDIVLIAFLLGEKQVGLYSAAYRLSFLVMAIAIALQSSYLPRLARAARDSLKLTQELAQRAFEFAATLAVPIAVGGWILASPLLSSLFGKEYSAAEGALRFLLLGMGLFFFNGLLLQLNVAFDRTRPELAIRSLAAVTNVVLNLIWIPKYGIQGAALATLVAEFEILVLRRLVCAKLGVETGISLLWKPIVAASGMAAIMIWIGTWGGWGLMFVLGGLTYVALLAVLRGLPRDLRA